MQNKLHDQADIAGREDSFRNKNIEQTFVNNADNHDGEKVKNLDNLSDRIRNKSKNIKNEFNQTSNSTIKRTIDKIAENIGIKDNKNN
ncbi:MAG: hypothetical protein LN588_00820 [Rickettsia endosymbiont of Bryobia graminum]|nr:hypothetical protein [Rickettsia endosymbiont of Bryobia graminum]